MSGGRQSLKFSQLDAGGTVYAPSCTPKGPQVIYVQPGETYVLNTWWLFHGELPTASANVRAYTYNIVGDTTVGSIIQNIGGGSLSINRQDRDTWIQSSLTITIPSDGTVNAFLIRPTVYYPAGTPTTTGSVYVGKVEVFKL